MLIDKEIANTIVDPRAYADPQRIDAAFATLRVEAPFAQAQPDGFSKFWVASRHADILEIERQPQVFANGAGPTNLIPRESHDFVVGLTGEQNLIRSLVTLDGDEHKSLRALLFPAMTPRAVRDYEQLIRGIAEQYVEDMIERGPECDFARETAFHYPLRVIMTLLGIPPEDEAHLLRLTQQMFGNADPDLNRAGAELTRAEITASLIQVMADLEEYFDDVTRRYRAEPTHAINSVIANAKLNGQYLNRRQLMGYFIIAATAGHDTTANTTASAMWALAERPNLFARLKSDPNALPAFVEESIRWATPVKTFMRTAIANGEIRGQVVNKGDWVLLSYHSANRDEEVFDDPFEFRIDRNPNRQIAFGSGPHVCLGQHLARLELRAFWECLLARLDSIELAGKPALMHSNFVVGPKSVPIRFTAQ